MSFNLTSILTNGEEKIVSKLVRSDWSLSPAGEGSPRDERIHDTSEHKESVSAVKPQGLP